MSKEQLIQLRQTISQAKKENKKDRNKIVIKGLVSAAAVLAVGFLWVNNSPKTMAYAMERLPVVIGRMVSLVSFYEYQYEDERHHADLEIPQLEVESMTEDEVVQEKLEATTVEINAEIQEITDEIIAQFETYLTEEKGYQEFVVKSEVLATTENYFTLKLMCYQGAGSGYQWNYYYTIELNTGERLQLKDIFKEGEDFITPISENIKEQMRAQMKRSFAVTYWVDDEMEEFNFESITDEVSFYLNANNQLVIAFNEGEVAPMSMGIVEFVIPNKVIENIRK